MTYNFTKKISLHIWKTRRKIKLTTALHVPGPVTDQRLFIEHQAEGASELVGRQGRHAVPCVIQAGEEPAAILRVGVVAGLGGTLEPVAGHRSNLTRACRRSNNGV